MLRRLPLLTALVVAVALAAPAASGAASGGFSPSPAVSVSPSGGVSAGTTGGGGGARGSSVYSTAPLASGQPSAPQVRPGAGARDIPRAYLRLYRATGRRLGVDWRVLAAIGKIESDHGRSTAAGVASGLNFASCCSGPMQICTVASCGRVWQHYAVDADGDGTASVYDPPDAIAATARIVRDLESVFGTRVSLLLAAYNAGPAAVQRAKGVPDFPETRAYVALGLRYVKALRAKRTG
jgi:soluble lytic murein transglycosylase-like protein